MRCQFYSLLHRQYVVVHFHQLAIAAVFKQFLEDYGWKVLSDTPDEFVLSIKAG